MTRAHATRQVRARTTSGPLQTTGRNAADAGGATNASRLDDIALARARTPAVPKFSRFLAGDDWIAEHGRVVRVLEGDFAAALVLPGLAEALVRAARRR